jgi:alginate O-acetyltransferase complex protein AlgI
MLFNSIPFLIFLFTYILSVFFFRNQWKNITISFSVFFYAYWNIYLCLLLVAEALFAWFIGRSIELTTVHKKKYLLIGLIFPLLILFIFKYYNFFTNDVLRIDFQNSIFTNIILPIGISFYTFQTVMYVVDVYKKKLSNIYLKDFLVFFLFFPHLTAGPLVRPNSFIPQIERGIVFNSKNFKTGILLILWGYFLKICISNNLAIYVNNVLNHLSEVNSSTMMIGSFFYSFLIYSDFAGYSLIAIGIAKIIGLNIPANFKNPFFSKSLTEFWHRWHISLSSFLKDYLYIPLGGNKFGLFKTCKNIFTVMLIGGLWHGASFNFIIWGALHGFFLCIEKINSYYFKINTKIRCLKKIYTFVLVTLIFIPFSIPNFESLLFYFKIINFTNIFDFSQIVEKFYVARNILLILILIFVESVIDKKKILVIRRSFFLYGFMLTMLLSLIISFGNFNESSFIYFQF